MSMFLWVVGTIRDFIDLGGPVLWVLFAACLTLWAFILERLWFVRITWPMRAGHRVTQWQGRADRSSWRARKIREAMVSEVSLELHALLCQCCWRID